MIDQPLSWPRPAGCGKACGKAVENLWKEGCPRSRTVWKGYLEWLTHSVPEPLCYTIGTGTGIEALRPETSLSGGGGVSKRYSPRKGSSAPGGASQARDGLGTGNSSRGGAHRARLPVQGPWSLPLCQTASRIWGGGSRGTPGATSGGSKTAHFPLSVRGPDL